MQSLVLIEKAYLYIPKLVLISESYTYLIFTGICYCKGVDLREIVMNKQIKPTTPAE